MGSDAGEAYALEEARAGGAALLRMELDAEESAALRCCDDALRVRARERRLGRVRVREVEVVAELVDTRPADARHAAFAQSHGAPGNEAETLDAAVLLALLERELQAEADSEHGTARVDARAQRVVEAALAEPVHRCGRRADARQHSEIRTRDVVDELDAETREGERNGTHVAGAVVADRDVHIVPFVDGIPSPSRRTATRNARPSALNAASAT